MIFIFSFNIIFTQVKIFLSNTLVDPEPDSSFDEEEEVAGCKYCNLFLLLYLCNKLTFFFHL